MSSHPVSLTARNLAVLGSHSTLPLAAKGLVAVALVLAVWAQRARTRQSLARLSDHELADIGLTRSQAHYESNCPFWEV